MAAIAVAAGPRAEAGIVQITDFTLSGGTSSIGAFGFWQWDQTNRELLVGRNTANDYLFGTIFPGSAPNIQGVTTVSLTAAWTPLDPPNTPDGQFILALYNQGDLKASAVYNYGNFASGQTVVKSLTWTTDPSLSTVVDQWQIIGNGNSDQATERQVSSHFASPSATGRARSCAVRLKLHSLLCLGRLWRACTSKVCPNFPTVLVRPHVDAGWTFDQSFGMLYEQSS
jgi:hypothetical protein